MADEDVYLCRLKSSQKRPMPLSLTASICCPLHCQGRVGETMKKKHSLCPSPVVPIHPIGSLKDTRHSSKVVPHCASPESRRLPPLQIEELGPNLVLQALLFVCPSASPVYVPNSAPLFPCPVRSSPGTLLYVSAAGTRALVGAEGFSAMAPPKLPPQLIHASISQDGRDWR
ncbi:hypothetical protein BGZ61DRAFT_207082 [Ilyonectria robusta]|uniref:uncharacterized protein n=1 Tax=Ilyonectria robusta TaxID=1079257 RepID=UPI001E8E7031|nr:uncharacterized protein BGZ61DRAFT_207082 [Ilyonectria robusta]KAH8714165.1 hypothetical protein BGZ61DRAFT_207082 [Ilyonectria robusta]